MHDPPENAAPQRAFVRDALQSRHDRLIAFADAVRAADVDAVHDMRVASRRLRAALAACVPQLDTARAAEYIEEVRGITRALGRPRELDVMLHMLAAEEERASGPWRAALAAARQALSEERQQAAPGCIAAADAAQRLVRWEVAHLLAEPAPPVGPVPLGDHELRRARRKLKKAYRRWQRSRGDAHLHALRVAFKHLRYTVEIFAQHAGAEDPLAAELKDIQHALGEWNDHRVLLLNLRQLPALPADEEGAALMLLCFKHRAAEHLRAFEMQAKPVLSTLLH